MNVGLFCVAVSVFEQQPVSHQFVAVFAHFTSVLLVSRLLTSSQS